MTTHDIRTRVRAALAHIAMNASSRVASDIAGIPVKAFYKELGKEIESRFEDPRYGLAVSILLSKTLSKTRKNMAVALGFAYEAFCSENTLNPEAVETLLRGHESALARRGLSFHPPVDTIPEETKGEEVE